MNGSDSESAAFGPFRLSAAARLIEKDGVPVELGARALDLLIALVERAGQVVSHKELTARVWRGLVVEPGNLRVHISALRKALGDDGERGRYIANVPGQGYCFVAPVIREARTAVRAARERGAAAPRMQPLPPKLVRMIGRDEAVRTIAGDLLAERFVTIVGPGGMGKTTVAVSVAHALSEEFAGKVYFVDLGAVADPQLVAVTVASTLGLSVQSADVLPTLMSFLKTARMLLVLDNCEHVIEAAAPVAEMIYGQAPRVHVLATSREALRVEGEHAYWLRPLEGPPRAAETTAATALTFPAVKLFVERAAASDSRFELTDANAPLVADICGRLDGIALALELVAGRVGAHGLQGIADLLSKHLGLHLQGRRTALPRHQTLRALLDWSYGLLRTEEQRLFRKLAIFVGPFTLEAAQAAAADADLDEPGLAAAIDSLVAKSLVSAVSVPHRSSTSYRLLETTRVYALKQLEASGEADGTAERHAAYVVQDLRSAPHENREGSRQEQLGNLRAALEWCLPHRRELGIELAATAVPVFLELSLWNECQKWAEAALAALPRSERGDARELVLQEALAVSSMFTGSSDTRAAIVRAIDIARRLGRTAERLRLLASLHFYLTRMTDFTGALAVAEEIDAVAQTTDDGASKVLSDWLRGSSQMCVGNQALAMQLFEHGFAGGVDQYVGNAHQLGIYYRSRALVGLARTRWLCGYPDRALRAAEQSAAEAADTSLVNQSYALLITCHVFLWCGKLATAQDVIDRVMAQPHWQGRLVWFHAEALALQGELLVRRGRIAEGIEVLRGAMAELKAKSHKNLMLTAAACALAEGLTAAGRAEEAVTTIDEAIAHAPGGERTWEAPELLRVRATALLALPQPDAASAERSLLQALELARRQSAKAWELRTTVTLARLRAAQGRSREARDALAALYAEFTEGFETADLVAARQLLGELAAIG